MIKPKPTHENDRVNGNIPVSLVTPYGGFYKERGNLVYREAIAVEYKNGGCIVPAVFHAKLCSLQYNFAALYCLN